MATSTEGASRFVPLRDTLGLTDGNLNRHLATLERAGLIARQRTKEPGRHPQTVIALTPEARERLREFAEILVGVGELAYRASGGAGAGAHLDAAQHSAVTAIAHATESVTLTDSRQANANPSEPTPLIDERFTGPD